MTAIFKQKPYRDSNLLKMAKSREPVATLPGVYDDPSTTVAAHGNCISMGKGKGQKAHDFFVIYVGFFFHQWLDQSNARREEKDAAFWCAYRIQLDLWGLIENDPQEKAKDRRSAGNAIDAFSDWVEQNSWRFSEGDWQLQWIKSMEVV